MVEHSENQTVEEDDDRLLFPGEEISLHSEEPSSEASNEELNSRYVKGEVRIVTESARYSLAGILSMLEEKVTTDDGSEPEYRYRLDPEYQRRHRWGDDRKSRLIESFLMNVPVPPVFLYERELARYEVMDGRQRLTALKDFYANKYALKELQHWPELNGRKYDELPSKICDGINRRYISAVILLQETASTKEQATKLKKIVFERLNSGGVELAKQETRNAVYDGPLNQLCMELSQNELFRAFWALPNVSSVEEEDEEIEEQEDTDAQKRKVDAKERKGMRMFKKMEDVELVLRFFAYRQLDSFPSGLNKISDLLDKFLPEGNKFPKMLLDKYREMFLQTISFLSETLGTSPFCRLDSSGQPKGQQNKIVYDPLMYVASQYSQSPYRDILIGNKEKLKKHLGKMYEKYSDLFSGRRTNKSDTQQRNKHMKQSFVVALKEMDKKG
jgi:hypothetical protein